MNLRLLVLKSFKKTIMLNDRNDITRNAVRVRSIFQETKAYWRCPMRRMSYATSWVGHAHWIQLRLITTTRSYQVGYLGMIRESLDTRTNTWYILKIFNRAYLSLQSNVLVYKINSSFLSISQFTTFFVVYRKKTNLQKFILIYRNLP